MVSELKQEGLITADIRIPWRMRIFVDGDRVLARVGTRLADRKRRQLRGGKDGAGKSLPVPKDGGDPLRRSDRLIKSIKYDKRTKSVRPVGTRGDLGRSLRGRNFALMAVLIHQKRIDPMAVNDRDHRATSRAAEREIGKQLKKGKAGLLAELRRVK